MPKDLNLVFSFVDSVFLINTRVPIRIHPQNETIAKTIAIFQYLSNKVRLKTLNRNNGIKMIKCFLLSNRSIFKILVSWNYNAPLHLTAAGTKRQVKS